MNWFRTHKFLVVVLGLIVLTLLFSALGSNNSNSSMSKPSRQATKSKKLSTDYQLVGETGPSNGIKAILIDPSQANEATLVAIGKKLDAQYSTSAEMRIGVYTARRQAELLLKDPLGTFELKGADAAAYKKAWVAQYTHITSANKKNITIYLNGTTTEVKL